MKEGIQLRGPARWRRELELASRARSPRRGLRAAACLFLALASTAARGQGDPPAADLPSPDLAGLEAAVAAQIAEARAAAVELLARPGATPAEQAGAVGDLARVYHAYGLLDAAADGYRRAHALVPGELRWPYLLGHVERARGDLDAARAAFEMALRLAPYPAARVALSEVELTAGRNAEAEVSAREATLLAPGDAGALAALGQALLALGRHAEAAQALEAALAALPAADRLHYPLALAYRALGDEPRARQHLARAGRAGARTADPLLDELETVRTGELVPLLRGRRAAGAGDWAAAEREFRRALAAAPESVPARINLAAALVARGAVEEARAELEAALRAQPGNATAHFNLGVLRVRAGDLAGAVEHLGAAAAAVPGDAETRRTLGEALLGLGRPAEALPHLEAAVVAAPADEPARVAEVTALARLGEERRALERLEAALDVMPGEGRIVHLLARLLAAASDTTLRDGARAVELAAQVWQAHPVSAHGLTLGLALAEAGRCAEAASLVRRLAGDVAPPGDAELLALADRFAAGTPCRPVAPPR